MASDSASADSLIDLVDVPQPFWKTTTWDWNPSLLSCHVDHGYCWYIRCAICGLQITDNSNWHTPNGGWATEALMVGDLSREYEYVQTYRRYPASCQDPAVFSAQIAEQCSYVKGCGYYLGRDLEGPCFPYAADVNSCNGGPDGKNVVYLPMHRACFNISLQSPRWGETSSSRLRGLFRVLRHRFQVKWEQCLRQHSEEHENDTLWMLSGSHLLLDIKMSGFQNTEGTERGYFSKECLASKECFNDDFLKKGHYLTYDPLKIPSLTNTLLKNLESRITGEGTKKDLSLRRRLRKLPNELTLLICEYLVQDQEWPLECTRLLGPRFWKALFNKDNPCMGWLWDLDFELVRRTDPDMHMDWELLFRQLSQRPKIPDCLGEHQDSDYEIFQGVLAHVPPGLEGRRRVWILVEEMRIGDRSARWELNPGIPWHEAFVRCETDQDVEEVPVYWGGDGEPLDVEELRAL